MPAAASHAVHLSAGSRSAAGVACGAGQAQQQRGGRSGPTHPALKCCLSLNFLSSLKGLLASCPNVRTAEHLIFVEHCRKAPRELAALRAAGVPLPARVDVHTPNLRDVGDRGMHHSKVLLLQFVSGIRLIVFTGAPDPEDRTPLLQGVWWQDFPPLDPAPELPAGCPVAQMRPTDDFGRTLFDFLEETLQGFKPGVTLKVLRAIASTDFSFPRAALVPSVPGRDRGYHWNKEMEKWGQIMLRLILRSHALQPFRGSVLYATASLNQMLPAHMRDCRESFGDLKLLWPSCDSIRNQQSGWQGGNALPGKREALETPHIYERLHRHTGLHGVGAEQCPAHIKQCAWLQEDGQVVAVMVGSHNFSQAAWGLISSDRQSMLIRNYELSVLSLPSLEEAWRRSPQFGFTCTPRPGAPPPGPDPLMAGCARVEFVPFSADSPEACAPCVVTAADGSRVLRLPVPLTFCLDPRKYEKRTRISRLAHDYKEKKDYNGQTVREALAQPKWHTLLERTMLSKARKESLEKDCGRLDEAGAADPEAAAAADAEEGG